MLLERIGYADGWIGSGRVCQPVGFGSLDAPLDFANIIEVIAEPRAVTCAQFALQVLALFGDGVENGAFARQAKLVT